MRGVRGERVYVFFFRYRMGCVKFRFFRDRGKVLKSEFGVNSYNLVYVSDFTFAGKRVSGGRRGFGCFRFF